VEILPASSTLAAAAGCTWNAAARDHRRWFSCPAKKGNRADIWSTPSPNKPGPTVLPEIAKQTRVIALTAGQVPISAEDIASGRFPPEVTQVFVDSLWAAQLLAQDNLAGGLFPGDKHIMVENSHHYIPVEQPQVVINAIRDVVEAMRERKTTLLP
jgi:hypothetical protein